jgi:hypothetical protein
VSPTLVVEVRYDRFTGGHFRRGKKFLRWRPDKSPLDCLLSSYHYVDLDGLRHSVELEAESLYEAAVKAIVIFR